MRKVKSTKTTVMKLMEDIIRKESKILLPLDEEIICRKFGVNRNSLWAKYDLYNYVCIRPNCGCCIHIVNKEKHKLIEDRNYIIKKELKDVNKNKLIENIYKGSKSGS
jgi:hypothetical protein